MNKSTRLMKFFQEKRIEIVCALIGIVILLCFTLPKFLAVQKSGQIAGIQSTLDQIIQRMIDRPETFIDITIAKGGAVRDDEAVIVNGEVMFPSMWPVFSMKSSELTKILSEFQPADYEQDLMFHFAGGHIGGTEERMRKRNWDWNKHYVMVYVNINGASFGSGSIFERGVKHPDMEYPPERYLYDSSNGLDSRGMLYAHTYDWYLSGKTK